jgi:hypothetical protein
MVVTTEKGGRVIDEFRRRRNEVFAATLARLSEEDQLEVLSALSKFVSVLHGNEPARLTTLKEPPKGLDLQTDGRTAADSPEASKNQVGQAPVSLPTRRMRIEWD